ncbi:hypothetical protein AB0O28_34725 [Microbispora sp. NPDC088329]|uniref:hypothetical protein n=1 Tax=Microbispora sp. NPDC088329 TaxID=3154869 RepID=UPI00341B452E
MLLVEVLFVPTHVDHEEYVVSTIHWTESRIARSARWHSESAAPPPRRIVVADDRMKAGTAYRLAREGTALLWRGDYHNARQLLRNEPPHRPEARPFGE